MIYSTASFNEFSYISAAIHAVWPPSFGKVILPWCICMAIRVAINLMSYWIELYITYDIAAAYCSLVAQGMTTSLNNFRKRVVSTFRNHLF